jgi:probable blue pigment (indigoidine) exporter
MEGKMLGILAATMASLGWGTDAVLARQGLRQIPPALGTCLSLCAGLVACLVLILITDPGGLAQYPREGFAWFAMVGVINFLVGRQCNYNATKRLGETRAVSLFACSPLISILLAVLFTGETIHPLQLAGVALIVGGVVLVVTS